MLAWLLYSIVTLLGCLHANRRLAMASSAASSLCLLIAILTWEDAARHNLESSFGGDTAVGTTLVLTIVSLVLHVLSLVLVYFYLPGKPIAPPVSIAW